MTDPVAAHPSFEAAVLDLLAYFEAARDSLPAEAPEVAHEGLTRWLRQRERDLLLCELRRLARALGLAGEPVLLRAGERWRVAERGELWRAVAHLRRTELGVERRDLRLDQPMVSGVNPAESFATGEGFRHAGLGTAPRSP